VPPSGISYEGTQNEHADSGGVFVGSAWLGLPIFHATRPRGGTAGGAEDTVQRNASDPMVTWTHVIDTAQIRGPVLAYAPEFFTRRWVEWCAFRDTQDQTYDWQLNSTTMAGKCLDPSLYQTLGYSSADWMPSAGGEFNSIPTIFHDHTANPELNGDTYSGPTYWKLPAFGYPTGQTKEPYVLDVRTYNHTTYDQMVSLFARDGGATSDSFRNARAATKISSGSIHMASNPSAHPQFRVRHRPASGGSMDIDMETPMTVSREYSTVAGSGSDRDPIETNVYYEWTAERTWSRYAKTVRRSDGSLKLAAITEAEAPPSLRPLEYTSGLKGRASYSPHSKHASNTFDATCFECTNPSICEQQVRTVTVESGAVVSYRWWRWRDQPAIAALTKEFPQRYTEDYLAFLQTRVEWMHQHWDTLSSAHTNDPGDFFLKRPKALPRLAELEHVLVLDAPPNGVPAVGWVPVSLSEEFPPSGLVNGGATDGGAHPGSMW